MSKQGWVTIGQLAAYAGVTVRTVRHYEQRGLLPEPERDESGYRRYGAQALIDLVRIRTLADAGVPLARVREVLDAPAEEFEAAMRDIEARLGDEAAELERRRERVAALATDAAGLLPAELVGWLEDMRDAGIDSETIARERDGWLLAIAAVPDASAWIEDKRRQFRDPEFRRLYALYDRAMTGEPTDDQLRELVSELFDYTERRFSKEELAEMVIGDPDIAAMMISHEEAANPPALARYHELAREMLADHPLRTAFPPDHPIRQALDGDAGDSR